MESKKTRIITAILLTMIIGLGFFIRINNISEATNVDEPNIVKRAVQVADGELHIKWYNWPAQSLIRINGVIFKLALPILNKNNEVKQTAKQLYNHNEKTFNTVAHCTTVLFALISILLLFLIGKSIHNNNTGLLASFFLAVNYLHCLHSRFATPDVPMTFAFLLNIWLAIKLYKLPVNNDKKNINKYYLFYGLSGLVLGFAVATKYTGALAIIPIILVALYKLWQQRGKNLKKIFIWPGLIFIGAAILCHTIFNPYFFQDIRTVINNIMFEAKPNRLGVDWGGANNKFFLNLFYYLKSSLAWNGTAISLIAYATMITSFIKIKKINWQPIIGINIFFLFILFGLSTLGLHWSRWAVPFSPLTSLMGALGLILAIEYLIKKIKYKKITLFFCSLLLIVIVFPQVLISIVTGYSLKAPTTGEKISAYINNNVPAGSTIVADTYNLKIDKNKYNLQKKSTNLIFYKSTFTSYQAAGVNYLVIKPKRLAYAKQQPKLYKNIIDFHQALNQNSELLVTYKNNRGLLGHKRDYGVYLWLWQNGFNKISDMCEGTYLSLYKI